MNIIIANDKIESNLFKPFTSTYDKVYVSVNDEFEENNDFKLTSKNIKKLFDLINFSWDGEIYWFSEKEKVLHALDEWFKKEENHTYIDDFGISNCFLIKYTPNGICIIDTQLDMSSNINSFIDEIVKKFPNINYECYSDCHLINNIKIGRNSINDEFETLYHFYKEKIIDASFFLSGLAYCYVDELDSEYCQILPHDKTIVITGKLACEREDVFACLEEAGYSVSDKVNANSWLWYGDKVGSNKIQAAKDKNVVCTSIDDVIEQAYQKYLSNKIKLNHKNKP